MLSVPWHIPSCNIKNIKPEYDGVTTSFNNEVFTLLEQIKEEVGVYKLKNGSDSWRHAVNSVDTNIRLPLTLQSPINRAYYKMIEIIRTCIIQPVSKSFHMCEAPGGFVQACMTEFKSHNLKEVHSTSLIATNNPIISSILKKDGVNVHSFENNDICMENIREQHIKEIGKHSCELITADGAIDNDHNPENTEENSACLLASEIKLAMHLQKEGGTFVVKVFGARLKITCELIAILCHLYKNVQIVKPLTSRSVNDERYIVCQEFQCDKIIDMPNITHGYLTHICDIDPYWFNELEKTVTTLANTQYTYLKKALSFDKNKHGKGKGYRGKGGRGIHKSRGRGYYTTSN